ncbi:MAG: EcsC family protein [Candidatus Riflebacteria bacterium]|nr:EcsC family protein [Candidatus Riflebacteria bacterium]
MSDHPNAYEKNQVSEIKKWQNQEPGIVTKALGFLSAPLVWGIRQIVPESAIRGALNFSCLAASALTDTEDILRAAKEKNRAVSSIGDLSAVDLEISDQIAESVHNWALVIAGTEGGITGVMGLLGLAVDIPAVITFSLRTIKKIGICYGFNVKTQEEELFVLQILSAAGANSLAEKTEAIVALKMIYNTVEKITWIKINEAAAAKVLSKEGFIMAVKNLAKQLGINLTKRKVLQTIPVIGGGIGAAVNADFIGGVTWAARRMYQKRWLEKNGCVVE